MVERCNRFTGVLLATSVLVGAAAPAGARTFYVSPTGNDAWSGTRHSPNATRTDGPFGSIARARDAIRRLMSATGARREPVRVQIRKGTYCLSEPVTFLPEDSGTREFPISYEAYPGERPVLCGGRRITGWRPYRGSIQCVFLPEVKAGKWHFRSLFVDGKRQIRARHPNVDPADPYRKGFLYVAKGLGGFGQAVGCIHNGGDWMEYNVTVPADGVYHFWTYYGAMNKRDYPGGHTSDMAGRTVLIVDRGKPAPLMNLPDTGGWSTFKWADNLTVRLTKGRHVLRWQNVRGGGLNIEAFALSDDPGWKPVTAALPKAAPGKHVVVIQAEDFVAYHGKQLKVVRPIAGASRREFQYKPGDLKPHWAKAPEPELHIWPAANACRAFKEMTRLAQVDEASHTVTLSGHECVGYLGGGDRYFVENLLELLDRPGEWYLERQTGMLYYWPAKGPIGRSDVIAPVLRRVFQFEGDAAKGQVLTGVRFAGLTITCTDYALDDGCTGYGMGTNGTIYLRGAVDCEVRDCRFINHGTYAVCLIGGSGNKVVGNDIAHGAEGGIVIWNASGNTVSDNHIHHCGAAYKHVAGVYLVGPGARDNVVSHNRVHDMARYGISLKNPGQHNSVEFNYLYNLNLETCDTAAIEVTQQDKTFRSGSVIHHNIVHDSIGFSSDMGKDLFGSSGIYLDSCAGGYTVHHNIIYHNAKMGIHLQGGKNNKVLNNILADNVGLQLLAGNFARNATGVGFWRNIVYCSRAESSFMRVQPPHERFVRFDHNLYFRADGKPPVFHLGHLKGEKPLAEWQKTGFDVHAMLADPLFVDPGKGHFALRPDSPAFKLGFEAIDTSRIGLVRKRCHCQSPPASRHFQP